MLQAQSETCEVLVVCDNHFYSANTGAVGTGLTTAANTGAGDVGHHSSRGPRSGQGVGC